MLGRFLELSLAARPIGESYEFYQALGFAGVPTGDILVYPYAVVHDGRLCVGLHERDSDEPLLTFIRPDLKAYWRALRRHRIDFEFTKLGDDEFNEIGFRDPNGQLIVLLEAQTFSPGTWEDHSGSVCGRFVEYSLMTTSRASAAEFWQALGFHTVGEGETPHPWIRLKGHGLSIGFHETVYFQPGPSFATTNLDARLEYLRAKGLDTQRSSSTARALRGSTTLVAPEGTPLYLIDEAEALYPEA